MVYSPYIGKPNQKRNPTDWLARIENKFYRVYLKGRGSIPFIQSGKSIYTPDQTGDWSSSRVVLWTLHSDGEAKPREYEE